MNLGHNVKITRLLNGVAAGTGDTQTSSVLDMQGYDGVMLVTGLGAITATAVTSVKVQDGAVANLSDASDLAGSKISFADTDDNKAAIHDIYRPLKRYLQLVITRATANAVIDGIFAVQYRGDKRPTTHDATTVVKYVAMQNPAEGTA